MQAFCLKLLTIISIAHVLRVSFIAEGRDVKKQSWCEGNRFTSQNCPGKCENNKEQEIHLLLQHCNLTSCSFIHNLNCLPREGHWGLSGDNSTWHGWEAGCNLLRSLAKHINKIKDGLLEKLPEWITFKQCFNILTLWYLMFIYVLAFVVILIK